MNEKVKFEKRQRVTAHFLDAAAEVSDDLGINNVTIRNVADRAGYNGATLYNYFENLDELIAFTVIHYVSRYFEDVSACISDINSDPFGSYYKIWDRLCFHGFNNPQYFAYSYSSTLAHRDNVQSHIKKYYQLFPQTFSSTFDKRLLAAFFAPTSSEHDKLILKPFVEIGLFHAEDVDEITMYGTILYDGILSRAIFLKDMSASEYTACYMKYFLPFIKEKADPVMFALWEERQQV